MIKIALLDDHAILRDGIKHLLNSEADPVSYTHLTLPTKRIV